MTKPTDALRIAEEIIWKHTDWNSLSEQEREALSVLRSLVVTEASDHKTYMTPHEVKAVHKHLASIESARKAGTLLPDDHALWDGNGEPLGKVSFNEDVVAFVFEYDYIKENHA